MGSIMQGLFGGSKQKSQQTSLSENVNNDYLKGALKGSVEGSGKTQSFLEALLGIGGDPTASNAAFKSYRDSAGYDFIRDEGIRGINGTKGAQGLYGSGSRGKALAKYSTNLASTFYDNYLNKLLGLQGQGLQAAGILSNSGQRSQSQGTSSGSNKPGIGGFLGSIISGGAAGGGG